MFSVLDQPDLRQRVSKLSVAEYHQLGEFNENGKRTELIRGIVIEKMSKSPLHSTIASLLHRLVLPQLPAGFCARYGEPLTLRDSEPEPDLAVVAGTEEDYAHAHPPTAALAVEVAVTSAAADRLMAEIYAEAGVAEYWIVLPRKRTIEVYRQPDGSGYREMRTYSREEELPCSTVPGLRLSLADLYAGLD